MCKKSSRNNCVLTPDYLGVRVILLDKDLLGKEDSLISLFFFNPKCFLAFCEFLCTYTHLFTIPRIVINFFQKTKYCHFPFLRKMIKDFYFFITDKKYICKYILYLKTLKFYGLLPLLLISFCCDNRFASILNATGGNL